MARDGASPLPPGPETRTGRRAGRSPTREANANPDRGGVKSTDLTAKDLPEAKAGDGRHPASADTPKSLVHRHVPNSRVVLALLDLVFLGVAQAIVFGQIHRRLDFADLSQATVVVAISMLTSMVFLYASGCYRRDTMVDPVIATSRLPIALGFTGLVLFLTLHYGMAILVPTDPVYLSISRCTTVVLIGAGASLCAALLSRALFYAMARHHWFRRRILVIGTGKRALHIHRLMGEAAHKLSNELSFAPESIIGGAPGDLSHSLEGASVSADIGSIDDLVCEHETDEIVIAADKQDELSLECLLGLKASGIPITDYHTFIERETRRVDLSWLEVSWLLYSNGFRLALIDAFLKRAMDLTASAIILLISLPTLLLAIIAIRLEGPGPIFYRQQRITRNGRVFSLYKLRTMHTDAERQGPKWADQNDPRITRVGLRLRRWRIDEVPQLINVLRGDMSLVGPRPERPIFVEQLSREIPMYPLRHNMRAGVTGWAQINYPYGASVNDAKRKLEYDLYYIKNYSLSRDLKILLQTMRVLLWPEGVR